MTYSEIELDETKVEKRKEELLDELTEVEVYTALELHPDFDPVDEIHQAYLDKDYEYFGRLIHEAVRRSLSDEKQQDAEDELEQEMRDMINGDVCDD